VNGPEGPTAAAVALSGAHRAAIREHGAATYPHECCGFLVGERGAAGAGTLRVRDLVRAENIREDSPHNRYLIDPAAFVRVQRAADARGLDIVGFYHSHPDAPARPSEFDREHAWPHYAYLIVRVAQGEPGELHAFALSEDRATFHPIPLLDAAEEP
jgi:proteasome lid subunit RPN8/RPN11